MKSSYVWIVVFFRSLAVCVALYGLFAVLSGMVLTLNGGFSVMMMLLRLLLVYWLSAFVLWLLSRPVARLVLSNLSDGVNPKKDPS